MLSIARKYRHSWQWCRCWCFITFIQALWPISFALVHKQSNSQMHRRTHAHTQTLTHTDLISTWKRILQHPPVWCAKLSWWLHLVYISPELDHDLQQGCCLSLICSLAYLLLIRKIFQNNASNCAHKALQGERSRADMHTYSLKNKQLLGLVWRNYVLSIYSGSYRLILMLKLMNTIFSALRKLRSVSVQWCVTLRKLL